jgi:hypothetical protein
MKNYQKLSILLITCLFFLLSCKKKDQPMLLYSSGGTIQGLITGISQDGVALNESFNFSKYFGTAACGEYHITNDTVYSFTFERVDPDVNSNVIIGFTRTKSGKFSGKAFGIEYYKEMTGNKLLHYNPIGSEIISIDITDYSFDITSGLLKGKFSVTVKMYDNSIPPVARNSMVTGNFEITLKQAVYKKSN